MNEIDNRDAMTEVPQRTEFDQADDQHKLEQKMSDERGKKDEDLARLFGVTEETFAQVSTLPEVQLFGVRATGAEIRRLHPRESLLLDRELATNVVDDTIGQRAAQVISEQIQAAKLRNTIE